MRDNFRQGRDVAVYTPPPLPDESKPLSFEECVVTATQQAPDMVSSVVSLELAEVAKDEAFWKRVPKLNANFRVVTKLTQNHKEYDDMSYTLGLGVYGFEPVVSFFQSRAADLLENIAIYTHQKAVEKRAQQIGESLLTLESLQQLHALAAAQLALAQQAVSYYRARQSSPEDKLELAKAAREESAAALELEKVDLQMASLRTGLKLLLGMDLDRQVQVRPETLTAMLEKDNAAGVFSDHSWESVWKETPDARMLKISSTLHNYDIQIAWARYLPTVTMDVFTANPKSDYAMPRSDDEIFLALNFSIPLFDWGDRARGVETSRLKKIVDTQRGKLGRVHFAAGWSESWRALKLARANHALAQETLSIARLDEQKYVLQQKSGQEDFSALITARSNVIFSEIALANAELELRLADLRNWIQAGYFRRRFFEPLPTDDMTKTS